jgi:hypothetical protein
MAKKEIIGYGVMDFDAGNLAQFFEHEEDAAQFAGRLLGGASDDRGGSAARSDGPARHLQLVRLEAA